jgi:protein quaking
MTAKQLEQETGCKIMVRGRGSMRDKKKEEANRGKPNWEHLNDELHVLITVEDTPNRANVKIQRAIEEVKKLLIPVVDGDDELKKRQLMELAIINGTYRDSSVRNGEGETARMMPSPISLQHFTARHNQQQIGAPLMISPAGRHLISQSHLMNGTPPALIPADNGLLYPFDAFHHHYLANPNLLQECYNPATTSHGTPGSDSMSGSGQLIANYR